MTALGKLKTLALCAAALPAHAETSKEYLSIKQEVGQSIARGNAWLAEQPTPQESGEWDSEYRQRLFVWAADQVRTEFQAASWQAFWPKAA